MKGHLLIIFLISFVVHWNINAFVDARVTKSNPGYSRDNEEDLIDRFLQTAPSVKSTKSPSYVKSTKSPSYVKSTKSPSYVSSCKSTKSPSYIKSTKSPSYSSSTKSPSYSSSTKSPSYVKSTKSPSYVKSTKSPSYVKSTKSPSYSGKKCTGASNRMGGRFDDPEGRITDILSHKKKNG